MFHPRLLAIAVLIAAPIASPSVAAPLARIAPPAMQAADDADLKLVREAILKAMSKVKAEDVTADKTIAALGGQDINFMEITGDLQANPDLSIDDDAIEKTVNLNASKKMSDVTVGQLAQLVHASRSK
jgi:cell division ATPase FtsA